MKISCLPVSIFKDFINGSFTLGDWANTALEIGLDGIDMSVLMIRSHTPSYLAEICRMLKPIQVVMATAYPDFTNPDKIQRSRELQYFKADIALCSQLNIPYLRVLAGQNHPGIRRSDGIEWAIENIRSADAFSTDYGVRLLFENHSKPSVWQYYDFSYPLDIFLEILDGIKNTNVRLNFDIANFCSLGVDPMKILPGVYSVVETIHVSDIDQWGHFTPSQIGSGIAPISEVFSFLRNKGFSGWLCIEEASNQGITGIVEAVEFVRKQWESA